MENANSLDAAARGDPYDPIVLHLVYSLEHGGTERFLCAMLNRLAGDGFRHVVCTQRVAGERAEQLGPHVTVCPLNLPASSRLGFLKLARFIRELCPVIVHARNIGTWTDALVACRVTRHPRLVLGFHGLQQGSRFTAGQRRRFRALGAASRPFSSVSHAGQALLVQDLKCSPAQVQVLPNGVDTERFCPPTNAQHRQARAQLGVGDDELAVGVVGNMFSSVKGHALLIDACAGLLRTRRNVRLIIAGFGPLQDELTEQARRLGILERIQFLGAIENPAEMLAALDLYVCPSLSEGMSNALLEAMACGRACVATDVGDHRRMLARIEALDALAPAGDAGALATVLDKLLADERRRHELEDRVRKLVATDYGFETSVAAYSRFYRALLPDELQRRAERRRALEALRCPP